jgi:hypothetical protein
VTGQLAEADEHSVALSVPTEISGRQLLRLERSMIAEARLVVRI